MWVINPDKINHPAFPKDTDIILLDTEGLGSYTKSKTYDIQIFSLAVLLSSFFVYNSVGSIDETALDRLSYYFLFFSWFLGGKKRRKEI